MMKKILLVEDNEAEAEIVKLLVDDKYSDVIELIHIENGLDVIEYINNNNVDLILLDINIPGKNGKEIAKYIRFELKKYIPIVILSTSDNNNDVNECYSYYVNSYLVKPINFNVFEEMFDRVIQYWIDFNTGQHNDTYSLD